MQRIQRLRALMAEANLDVIVLTHPNDVLYTTGYQSVLERWQLQEPLAAAVVPADPREPVMLCIPEAMVGLLAVAASQGKGDRAEELRVFDLLVFCEVMRRPDPFASASSIGEESLKIYGERVRGRCEPDIIACIAATLGEHRLQHTRVGFDDLRVGAALERSQPSLALDVVDGLDVIVRSRMIKTEVELEELREVGKVADRCLIASAQALEPGVTWDEVQYRTADAMTRMDVIPVDEGAMLFGGAFRGEFIPELFRTRHDRALDDGQIVILETQGTHNGWWIDINRTATIGTPSPEYQELHDHLRDAFLKMVDHMKPGNSTGDLAPISFEHLRNAGLPIADRTVVVAHGIGYMTLEYPHPYPTQGLRGVEGFTLEEGMVISLDCLYFGSYLGPCHMENVHIIEGRGAVSTYETPLELLGPR
jgi:Xaa-Pro dipeptidase